MCEMIEGRIFSKKMSILVLLSHWNHPVQENANLEIIDLLIRNGADINHEDVEGKTAYDVAVYERTHQT